MRQNDIAQAEKNRCESKIKNEKYDQRHLDDRLVAISEIGKSIRGT